MGGVRHGRRCLVVWRGEVSSSTPPCRTEGTLHTESRGDVETRAPWSNGDIGSASSGQSRSGRRRGPHRSCFESSKGHGIRAEAPRASVRPTCSLVEAQVRTRASGR